ncbi:hypothetical protein PLESTM_000439000 [Pleodorina starrii]|nr:hypothetical protein PLESTM_000439000 [Pleodorina starrii]
MLPYCAVRIRAVPYLSGGVYPTVSFFKFKPCPKTGRPLVYEQYEHVSRDSYIVSLGAIAGWVHHQMLQPMGRFTAGLVADTLDWAEAAWARLRGSASTAAAAAVTGGGAAGASSGSSGAAGVARVAGAAIRSSYLGDAAVIDGGGGGGGADTATGYWYNVGREGARPATPEKQQLGGVYGEGAGASPYGSDYTPSTGTTTARSSSTGGGGGGGGAGSGAAKSP